MNMKNLSNSIIFIEAKLSNKLPIKKLDNEFVIPQTPKAQGLSKDTFMEKVSMTRNKLEKNIDEYFSKPENQELLNKITAKHQELLAKYFEFLNVSALRKLSQHKFSGETLETRSVENLKKLKEYGIETVIDLRAQNAPEYEKKCNAAGIKFMKFPLDFIFAPGRSDIFVGKNREHVNDKFIENLKKFLATTENGKLYMGCQYGLDRTNFAIILDFLFNYKGSTEVPKILSSDIGPARTLLNKDVDLIRKIIKKMDHSQKETLNLPENFDEVIKIKIKELTSKNK